MGLTFRAPLLNRPGCPSPALDIFAQTTVGGAGAPICSLLVQPVPPTFSNVAVPGHQVADVYLDRGQNASLTSQLTGLMLGGRTQIASAREALPTFAVIWIGHNEILGAAQSGDASLATTPGTFTARYMVLMDSLATLNLKSAALLGLFDVTKIPAISRGSEYYAAKQSGKLPTSFTVDATCAPASSGGIGESVLVPHGYGLADLLRRAVAGTAVTLNCATDAAVLTQTETQTLASSVAAYNVTIAQQAQAKGWLYLDPNPVFDSLRAAGEVPLFPNLPPSPLATTQPFGKWLSLDGAHPSGLTHRLVANRLIAAVNAKYGTTFAPAP